MESTVWNQASSKHFSNMHYCWLLVACTLLQLPLELSPVATTVNIWPFQKLAITATSNCLMYKHLHTKKPHNLLPEVWLMWKHFLTTMYLSLNWSALGATIIRLRKLFTFVNVSSSNLASTGGESLTSALSTEFTLVLYIKANWCLSVCLSWMNERTIKRMTFLDDVRHKHPPTRLAGDPQQLVDLWPQIVVWEANDSWWWLEQFALALRVCVSSA
jgi:hypothetical protein